MQFNTNLPTGRQVCIALCVLCVNMNFFSLILNNFYGIV
jgi:hypothetical protein